MLKNLRHLRSRKSRTKALEELMFQAKIESIFRPYYLNGEKVNDYFVQEYGGLVEFTTTHGSKIAPEFGISAKNANLAALVAELAADAKIGFKKAKDQAKKRNIPTILRFNILRKYWSYQKRLQSLNTMGVDVLPEPHTLISHVGKYQFAGKVQDLEPPLTPDQTVVVGKQHAFEQKAEDEIHFLFLIESPVLAVSIISQRFITGVGFRFLPHYSSEESDTLFIGAVIGFKEGLLFLDPIGIGKEVTS